MNAGGAFMRLFGLIFRGQKTRLQVDWLTHTDEQILEHLSRVSTDEPRGIAAEIDRSVEYVADRCRQLTIRGMVEPVENEDAVYRLADLGEQYLAGEVDADELASDED